MTSSKAPPGPPRRRTRASPRPRRPIAPATGPAAAEDRRQDEPDASAAGERETWVPLAVITGAHGLAGEVRLKLFTDDLARYRTLRGGGRPLTLRALRGLIARFDEIGDRTAAEALRGTELCVPRSALPPLEPGEYYHVDLIGLPCVASDDGEALGHVVAVENFGAGDVLEIERPGGARFMVPMRPEAVPEWGDRVVIDRAFVG